MGLKRSKQVKVKGAYTV